MIQEARRLLLLIGAGANRKLTAKMLRAFVDKTGIPFLIPKWERGLLMNVTLRLLVLQHSWRVIMCTVLWKLRISLSTLDMMLLKSRRSL
ncbi:hypothetical protein EBT25_09250 [bacterium]|nr:hypothetical protein [bacterium]